MTLPCPLLYPLSKNTDDQDATMIFATALEGLVPWHCLAGRSEDLFHR